jgi:hypothetical protein
MMDKDKEREKQNKLKNWRKRNWEEAKEITF